MTEWVLQVAPLVALVPVGMRWLVVAQREHYIAGSAVRFAWRWAHAGPINSTLSGVLVVAAAGSWLGAPSAWLAAVTAALVCVVWPIGLPGSGLAWTPRLRRVAGGAVVVAAGIVLGTAAALDRPGAATTTALVLAPLVVDGALWLLQPVERRLQRAWISRAADRLRTVGPRVVAITGSYGKTTVKEYARRVLAQDGPVLASPASFNNAMGLSRAINEHLAPGTRWFVAEMGTYGPGEIADMCSWIPPEIAAITAIGPVHLERFGSLDVTLAAKAEIAQHASVVVLNCDDDRLSELADSLELGGKTVIRCGTGDGFDVVVRDLGDTWGIDVGGETVGAAPRDAFATNVAVAIGIGVAAGVPREAMAAAVAAVEAPQHRQTVVKGNAGFWIIDDTFNSNPAGAAAALETLAHLDAGRKAVVTPGMVELGRQQEASNRAFASQAAQVADDLLIVKRSNRRALLAGASERSARVQTVPDRETAVAWVRANLGPGDAVLYENDLPVHYP